MPPHHKPSEEPVRPIRWQRQAREWRLLREGVVQWFGQERRLRRAFAKARLPSELHVGQPVGLRRSVWTERPERSLVPRTVPGFNVRPALQAGSSPAASWAGATMTVYGEQSEIASDRAMLN